MTAGAELRFPVIYVNSREPSMGIFNDQDALTTWSAAALRGGFHKGLQLIDITLSRFDVLGIPRHRVVGMRLPFFSRIVRVDLELSEAERISLDQLKRQLHAVIGADSGHWSSGPHGDQLPERIRDAKSFAQIAELLG